MVCCIGFGEFNKKYIYILIAVIFKFISQLTIGLGYSCLNGFSPLSENLSKSSITFFISTFICSIIIGLICWIKTSRIQYEDEELISSLSRTASISLETNQKGKSGKKLVGLLILAGLIFVFCEVYDQLFYFNGLSGLDYWMFEIIFLTFFMAKFLKYINSIHHRISLYICVSSSFVIKLISSQLHSRTIDDGFNNKKDVNIYDYIEDKYSHWLYIPLFIITFLIMITFRSLGNTSIKYLMDILYVSPFIILIIYGGCGIVFSLLYIIFDIIFKKEYLGELNIFQDKIANTLFYAIIYGIGNSVKLLFDILIIKDLSPFHMFAKYKIYYVLIQIILLFNKFIDKFQAFFFVEFTSDIICFFGFLIYLELIELRCSGLNYNLKRNIIERSSIENNIKEFDEVGDLKILNNSDNIDVAESLEKSEAAFY